MIPLTRYHTETGEILGTLTVGTELEVTGNVFMLGPDQAFADGHWSHGTHYILDQVPTARPATGLPATHTLAASTDWAVPDVPEGTDVLVDSETVGTVDATGLVLSFGLAGVWRVDLRPPFPWLIASCEVTVT